MNWGPYMSAQTDDGPMDPVTYQQNIQSLISDEKGINTA